jgi:hypothetical protein
MSGATANSAYQCLSVAGDFQVTSPSAFPARLHSLVWAIRYHMTHLLALETLHLRTVGLYMSQLLAVPALPIVLLWLRTVPGDMAGLLAIAAFCKCGPLWAIGLDMAFLAAFIAMRGCFGALVSEVISGATGGAKGVHGALVTNVLLRVAAIAFGFDPAFV